MIDFAKMAEVFRARREQIDALVAEGERPLMFLRLGGTALVGMDPSKPGRWRVTIFDVREEPVGHLEAPTFQAALEQVPQVGGDLFSASATRVLFAWGPRNKPID